MAEEVSKAERVVFVDAAEAGEPGTIAEKRIEPISVTTESHRFSPGAVLRLSQTLYGESPRAYLLTVAGETFETGDQLSKSIHDLIPEIVKRVKALVAN